MLDHHDHFDSTRWSLVSLARGSDPSAARCALEALCSAYWRPIYLFIRGCWYGREDALDLTQAFFALLLERHDFERARRELGRLRAFLLTSLRHFLQNDAVHQRARKRGGGVVFLSLDVDRLEAQYASDLADHRTPETIFDRQWAKDLVNQVYGRLRREWETAGKAAEFDILRSCIDEKLPKGAYQPLAARLGCTDGAARTAAHRLRQEFREELRATIADTLPPDEACDQAAIDDEMRQVFRALCG
jgi:DNA-directed RNA polymerase specialized sigma24 family protein